MQKFFVQKGEGVSRELEGRARLSAARARATAIVIEALRSGRRPGSAAQLANASRSTLYAWCAEHADFDARWDEAVATAADRMEEIVHDL